MKFNAISLRDIILYHPHFAYNFKTENQDGEGVKFK